MCKNNNDNDWKDEMEGHSCVLSMMMGTRLICPLWLIFEDMAVLA